MQSQELNEGGVPPTSRVQELSRSDVLFPYGSDDDNPKALASFGLRLGTPHEPPHYAPNTSIDYGTSSTPVLITRGAATKGTKGPLVCHVEGCQRDLSLEKKYYKRYRVCMEHLKMSAILVDGELQRFCQQCGRFHDLSKFDGDKRNCRERLNQHNRRRRKSKREAGGSDGSWDDFSQDQPSGKIHKGRRSRRLTTQSEMWTSGHSGFDDGSHGMSVEEQRAALGSVEMEMMQGIPVGVSGTAAALPSFADNAALTTPDTQTNAQERESLYNMVVHHILPSTQTEPVTDGSKTLAAGEPVVTSSVMSGTETIHNLTTLLQIPDSAKQEGVDLSQSSMNNAPFINMQGGMGMLQSVCVSPPGGNMPTVPMLFLPSSSTAPHQLSAVAIIPSASNSCSAIVPLPWQGNCPQPSSQMVPSSPPVISAAPLPIHSLLPMETRTAPAPTTESPSEIAPLVSLALSASGITQGNGVHSYHPTISPNQLTHFQMLMARQNTVAQNSGEVHIPAATIEAMKTKLGAEEEVKKEDEARARAK